MSNSQPGNSDHLEIQLQDVGGLLGDGLDTTNEREVAQLEPVDGGMSAWQVLISAFVFEGVFYGFLASFGVFQTFYSAHPHFVHERTKVPVIGTLAQGLVCLGAPVSTALARRYSRYQRHLIALGWALCILGLLIASFATTVSALIISQGMIYGLGFVLLLFPMLSLVSEWWQTRRGMAYGVLSSASGLTGSFMPIALNALLRRYDYQITLRGCAIVMFAATAPLLPLVRGRVPASRAAARQTINLSFFRSRLFWLFSAAIFVQSLGQYFPSTFIAEYAEAIGLPSTYAALLLAVLAVSQTVGQSIVGWLSDKNIHVCILSAACLLTAAAATSVLWGLGKSLGLLMLYTVLYGFFAYGFNSLRVAMCGLVSDDQSAVLATYSSFVLFQGIGIVLIGPIAAGLLSGDIDVHRYGALMYKAVVIFVAATSSAGAMISAVPGCLQWLHIGA